MGGLRFQYCRLSVATLKLALLVYFQAVSCTVAAGLNDFDYSEGSKGPAHWGDLNDEWRLCNNGKKQSPINITLHDAIQDGGLKNLRPSYSPIQPFVAHLGPFNVALEFGADAGGIVLDSRYYSLREYHTHIPSEHIVNGRRFPLEIHLVHKTLDDKNVAVIGVLYTYGKQDRVFDKVLDVVVSLAKNGGMVNSSLAITNLRVSGKAYYRYSGSLTTPPCSEGVFWTVLSKPRTISKEQARKFQIVFTKNNARPTQAINKRHVYYHG